MNFYQNSWLKVLFSLLLIASGSSCARAQQKSLEISAQKNVTLVLPVQTIFSEDTAAQELQHYLKKITGADVAIAREGKNTPAGILIYVGPTQFAQKHLNGKSTFADEEWTMRTSGNGLILTGGRPRGTLYAAYHFLEEIGGVRWWNPWEETVPTKKVLLVPALNKRSQPAFRYRDIYTLYANDGGRFMARSRLDRQGDTAVDAKYGGTRDYGPPYHVHTFLKYIDPQKYFSVHPEWYIGNDKKEPTQQNSQLAMSNPEMRREFLRLLLENIRKSRQDAIAKQLPVPDVYSVSQNDNRVGFVNSPADERLVAENGGAESAILLDFINYLADGIKDEFPDVFVDTLAYFSGEQAPTNINARDNVIIRLTDTQSNVLLPVTAERNRKMRENVEAWAKHAKNLRVWDYNITYAEPHVPQPTMNTYQPDLQFFRDHHVEGMFIEFEKPFNADMRDMKLWVLCKLLEDPNLNYDALVKEFSDGYYGAAGPIIREYLNVLEKAAQESGADIDWFAGLNKFTYLTTDFLHQADAIFDKAANAVKNDPVRMQRVAWARTSVDYASLRRFSTLMKKWHQDGKKENAFPLDRISAGKRYLNAMTALIHQRIPMAQQKNEVAKVQSLVELATVGPAYLPPPAKFRDVSLTRLFDYNASNTRNYQDRAKVVADKDAETGYATRYEIPDSELEKYKLPMPWGVYDTVGKKTILAKNITPADIPSAGYHWYKLGETTLTGHDYVYFFWSWIIQNDIIDPFDAKNPDAKYEIWADIKFEGPAFPHGKASDKNAISIERIVVVRQ